MDSTCDFFMLPFVEIEIRLGTIGKNKNGYNKFDSSIDRKYFEKIKEILDSGEWEQTVDKNTIEYIKSNIIEDKTSTLDDLTSKMNNVSLKSSSLKLITENNKKDNMLLKENISTEDFQINSSPFDIRYSINQEFNLKSQINSFSKIDCVIRNKSRKSFINQDFKYDLTTVIDIIGGVSRTKYEIEIEIIVNKNTLTWKTCYVHDFIECKVYDLINIVEPMERDKFKLNFKT